MTVNWYAHHLGDYSKKTQHLSMAEHGAYRLLLDHCYSCDGIVPQDLPQIFMICRARTSKEKSLVEGVIRQFFYPSPEGWRNKRVAQEMEKANNISHKRKVASKSRWDKSSNNNNDAPMQVQSKCNANAMQVDTQPQPTTTTTVSNINKYTRGAPNGKPSSTAEAIQRIIDKIDAEPQRDNLVPGR